MTGELFAIIAPVFVIAGVGLAWKRLGMPFDTETITGVTTRIGTPALILSTLARLEVTAAAFSEMVIASVCAFVFVAIVGGIALRLCRLPLAAFHTPLMASNAGNMGLPLCLFAFGQEGLTLAIAFFALSAVYQFTIGIAVASGDLSLRPVLRQPVIYAVLIGVVMILTGTHLPPFLDNTLRLLGGIPIPLMLVALGVSLASLHLGTLRDSAIVALLRLSIGLAAGLTVAFLLGLEGAARGVLIVQCAMPVAVFNYLFASIYNRQPEVVAGSILISTIISFVTLPGLLLLALGHF
ncbi:MAG: AEC family transporter [Pseudomonadota bacterium]|nr:AEC family transporter [Pseudomonadota bacterium]